MIARIWSGRTKSQDAEAYGEYVMKTGIKSLRETEGNLGAFLFKSVDGNTAEFIVMSLWDSMGQVRNFAGKDTDRAVYFPEDKDYLLEMDPNVRHFEILAGLDRDPALA